MWWCGEQMWDRVKFQQRVVDTPMSRRLGAGCSTFLFRSRHTFCKNACDSPNVFVAIVLWFMVFIFCRDISVSDDVAAVYNEICRFWPLHCSFCCNLCSPSLLVSCLISTLFSAVIIIVTYVSMDTGVFYMFSSSFVLPRTLHVVEFICTLLTAKNIQMVKKIIQTFQSSWSLSTKLFICIMISVVLDRLSV